MAKTTKKERIIKIIEKNKKSLHYNGKVYNTDKTLDMLAIYDELFNESKEKNINLLELGVRDGGSLLLWNDYFNNVKLVGFDISEVKGFDEYENISIFKGSQSDLELLNKICEQTTPNGFDIIIDDCSHIADLTKKSFWHLFDNQLKDGGIYVIEDWGTGYWRHWPDGHKYKIKKKKQKSLIDKIMYYLLNLSASDKIIKKANWLSHYFRTRKSKNHNYGMVGFIKELIDECGATDISHPELGVGSPRESKFNFVAVYPGIVFIKKQKL